MNVPTTAIVTLITKDGHVTVKTVQTTYNLHTETGNTVSINTDPLRAAVNYERDKGQSIRVEYIHEGDVRHYYSTGPAFMNELLRQND
jgi:hypothetical protein